jgi:hypothetical protein
MVLQVVWLTTGTISRDPALERRPDDFPAGEYEAAFLALMSGHLLPEAFVQANFDAVGRFVGRAEGPKPEGVRQAPPVVTQIIAGIASASRRFETAATADDRFQELLSRAAREKIEGMQLASLLDEPFFNHYASLVAAVEGLGYALAWLPYRAGAMNGEPKPRQISLTWTAQKYRVFHPKSPLTEALVSLDASDVLRDIREVRNMLEHRGAASITAPEPGLPTHGTLFAEPFLGRDLPIDENLTGSTRAWLGVALREVLGTVPDHMQRYPPTGGR